MGSTGRFGKYGDLKRKEKIRRNLVQQVHPASQPLKQDAPRTHQQPERLPKKTPK